MVPITEAAPESAAARLAAPASCPLVPSETHTGRLGALVHVADGCSYYPLTKCSGTVVNVSEGTAGQLTPYVGKDVRVEVVTRVCGRSIAGQELFGPVVVCVQLAGPCGLPPPQPCPGLERRVPPAVIQAALDNPDQVQGWGGLCNPGVPPGPANGRSTRLTIQNPGAPYSPGYNSVVFKCGCP
jgi:hypothetical protein